MSNEKMRKEFEAWVSASGKYAYMLVERVDKEWVCRAGIGEDRLGQYLDESVEAQWLVWQASRAAIEVEISGYDSLLRALYDGVDINDVVKSIEAQGLRVKVKP